MFHLEDVYGKYVAHISTIYYWNLASTPPPPTVLRVFLAACVRATKAKRQLMLKSGDDRNILMHAARGGDQMGVTAVVNACREHFCPNEVCNCSLLRI